MKKKFVVLFVIVFLVGSSYLYLIGQVKYSLLLRIFPDGNLLI
ncbi:hypothetical protein HMPREF0322_00530 [Desulfitobacterium hafniense DP7]|uniref:Uncharacterized protein n=1 Tax=Desulfitobacterium hafniense DP7 TaxID=537010 RepID=G9XHV4_DESHA|nr:hypothetical protein HMPREF0322_00530 [Desulfitobacterium hafniense DP7]